MDHEKVKRKAAPPVAAVSPEQAPPNSAPEPSGSPKVVPLTSSTDTTLPANEARRTRPEWAAGLRQLYDSVVNEPLPDSFADLISRLDDSSK